MERTPGDYAAPTEVVFNAGETSKDVTVTAVDDSVDDDGESVELTFGGLPDGVSEGATTQAVVRITDNDGRGIDLSSASLTVTEGASAAYTVALASRPTATVTVEITGHSGTDVSLDRTFLSFTVFGWETAQTVTVSAVQDLDANNDSATLTHTSSGADYTGVTAAVAVTVVDDERPSSQNRAPGFTDGASTGRSVPENTAPGQNVGEPVAARDPNSDRLTYSLGGTDSASFGIIVSSGQLRTKAALNYEAKDTYVVTVSVRDGKDPEGNPDSSTDDTIRVTINVTDVNEAPPRTTTRRSGGGGGGGGGGFVPSQPPVFTGGARTAITITGNSPAGANVGRPVSAADATNYGLTYSLDGPDAAFFTINQTTGQIRVATGTTLDYTGAQEHLHRRRNRQEHIRHHRHHQGDHHRHQRRPGEPGEQIRRG